MSVQLPVNTESSTDRPDIGLIAEQISLIAAGVSFCCKRVAGDDIFRARMERVGDEITALALDFERYAHGEIDDYESLIAINEEKEAQAARLRLHINVLESQINGMLRAGEGHADIVAIMEKTECELRTKINSLISSHNNEMAQAAVKHSRIEKEVKNTRATNGDLTRKLHSELKAHLKSRESLNVATANNALMKEEIRLIFEEKDRINGMTEGKCWHGLQNPNLKFYLHVFHYPLCYPHDPRDIDTPRFVNNLTFHINIRTTYGVDLVTRLDEWGMVQYQALDIFKGEIPAELFTHLIRIHHDVVATRNPHMKAFFEWAHSFPLENVHELSAGNKALLKDAMSVENLAQLGSCFTSDLTRIKGVGEVTARKWRQIAYQYAATWMERNGVVDLDTPMLVGPQAQQRLRSHQQGAGSSAGSSKKKRKLRR